jgi:hypothetical protein
MLLMVLVAILVVGTALVSVAGQNLLLHRASIDAHLSLQQRWGMASCQRTLLPRADNFLQEFGRNAPKVRGKSSAFTSSLQDRLILGGQSFDLMIADEDAKMNLNRLYDAAGQPRCEKAISALIGPMEAQFVQLVASRPSETDQRAKKAQSDASDEPTLSVLQPAIRSWGEVFDLARVRRATGDDRYLAQLTRRLSLFGTGRLNVYRADDETIIAVCKSKVSDGLSQRILDKIRDSSLRETNLILEQTVSNANDRRDLQQLLSSTSSSFSLWIEASNPRNRIQRWATIAPNEMGIVENQEFAFE